MALRCEMEVGQVDLWDPGGEEVKLMEGEK